MLLMMGVLTRMIERSPRSLVDMAVTVRNQERYIYLSINDILFSYPTSFNVHPMFPLQHVHSPESDSESRHKKHKRDHRDGSRRNSGYEELEDGEFGEDGEI